jgi:hypothetical protein
MDISQLTSGQKALYLLGIYGALMAVLYWFYRMLVKGPEE